MMLHMLTTVDNPFSPVTQFDDWLGYDEACGYYTLSYLARITRTSDQLSEADQSVAIENAIQEIVTENVNGLYRAVPIPEQELASAS